MKDRGEKRGREKRWKDLLVDIELKNDWLERLNKIPTITITSTDAGHPELTMENPESRSWIHYQGRHSEPLERAKEAFGDSAVYASLDSFYDLGSLAKALYMAMAGRKMFIIGELPGHTIWIGSPYMRKDLPKKAFQEWWETAIEGMEEIGQKSKRR